jgi:NAD+ synthase (glutamine-hydrolysing)
VADKVKKFFHFYALNRHKVTTLPPTLHQEGYGFDDNRFDMRPFLYDSRWEVQFAQIDEIATQLSEVKEKAKKK